MCLGTTLGLRLCLAGHAIAADILQRLRSIAGTSTSGIFPGIIWRRREKCSNHLVQNFQYANRLILDIHGRAGILPLRISCHKALDSSLHPSYRIYTLVPTHHLRYDGPCDLVRTCLWADSRPSMPVSARLKSSQEVTRQLTATHSPVSGYWDVYNPNTKCLSEGPPVVASVVYSMFFDIVVYILPMPVLWRVQLPLRQRLALVGVFAMGSL